MTVISNLQAQIDTLKEKQGLIFPMLDNFTAQATRECQKVMDQLKEKPLDFNEMIYEVKGEFDDECLRLRKERSDLQLLTGQIKEIGMRVDLNLEKALEDMRRLRVWNQKVKEILTLSTFIER